MKNNRNSFITLTFLHFCVDFVCVFGLYLIANMLDHKGKDDLFISIVFLLYNCLAFLLQPFFGMLVDRFKDPKKTKNFKYLVLLSLGVLLLGWTLFMILEVGKNLIFLMFIVVILFGLSNALFHVSAGKQVLMFTNKATPGGLFVSTGALGVGLGYGIIYLGAFSNIVALFFTFIPILIIALAAVNYFSELDLENNEKY